MSRRDRVVAALRAAWQRISRRAASVAAWLADWRAELLTACALVGGWALITAGIAALTSPLAWTFSAGVFLISSCGWELLYTIARRGLYALTRKPEARRG